MHRLHCISASLRLSYHCHLNSALVAVKEADGPMTEKQSLLTSLPDMGEAGKTWEEGGVGHRAKRQIAVKFLQ